jgi:hypothetical protein
MLVRLVITVCCKQCTGNINSGVGKLSLQTFVIVGHVVHREWFRRKGLYFWKCCYQFVRKISLYEHVSLSECLPTLELPRSPFVTPLYIVCGDRWRAKFTKEGWIHETIVPRILDAVSLVENPEGTTRSNNTQSSHISCKLHWGWRWDLRTFSVNYNKSVISV